jgi:SagB-type dehydrogenase family enzyme
MNEDLVRYRFGFLSSGVDDPRRINLRRGRFSEAYRERGNREDVVEMSHELTKLRRSDGPDLAESLAVIQQRGMLSVLYTQEPEFPLRPRTFLPEPARPDCRFSDVVRRRRSCRSLVGRPLALPDLSALLFSAIGQTATLATGLEDGRPVYVTLRSIPSGGALHPTRVFVVLLQDGDLRPAIYHYDAPTHSLELAKELTEPTHAALFAAFPIHPQGVDLADAAALFFVTTKFWRPRAKYGPRGYRYCLQEAGAACQNLNLMATALGLAHVVLGGFYDDEVHACLEIDGVDHAAVTAVAVGARAVEAEVQHFDVNH